MPRRDWRLRLADVLQAISRIQTYVAGMSFEQFCADDKTVDAVLRNIAIIGEVARHVPSELAAAHPGIPWRDMQDMRNVVVHVYFGVNKRILWDTIQTDLEPLVPLLRKMRDEA